VEPTPEVLEDEAAGFDMFASAFGVKKPAAGTVPSGTEEV
jgi:hypothetical protein